MGMSSEEWGVVPLVTPGGLTPGQIERYGSVPITCTQLARCLTGTLGVGVDKAILHSSVCMECANMY